MSFLAVVKEKIISAAKFIWAKKTAALIIALCVLLAIGGALAVYIIGKKDNNDLPSQSITESSSSEVSSQESSSEESSSEESSSQDESSVPASGGWTPPVSSWVPPYGGGQHYNTNLNIEDNVFMDALIYTGYNMKKHCADGRMWEYIPAKRKKGLGYLSNITYGGGSTGYETLNGLPNIPHFENGGLVCSTFVTYVYFNYLPNVAGIDTSFLPKPSNTYLSDGWYDAAKQWVEQGYSKVINWEAYKDSLGYIRFTPETEIPIGSLVLFRDALTNEDYCTHVSVYAGYKNGYNWLYHVGNDNGPEMCAIERMYFGPDPQWPFWVITPPSALNLSGKTEDQNTQTSDNGQTEENTENTSTQVTE